MKKKGRYIFLIITSHYKKKLFFSFYINHDLVRVQPLLPALQEIKQFLELAPKEIIVLDFHRFPFPSNFAYGHHKKLHELLKDQFEDLALAPNGLQAGKGPTLNEIWHQNKNLIICYGKLEIARGKFSRTI